MLTKLQEKMIITTDFLLHGDFDETFEQNKVVFEAVCIFKGIRTVFTVLYYPDVCTFINMIIYSYSLVNSFSCEEAYYNLC